MSTKTIFDHVDGYKEEVYELSALLCKVIEPELLVKKNRTKIMEKFAGMQREGRSLEDKEGNFVMPISMLREWKLPRGFRYKKLLELVCLFEYAQLRRKGSADAFVLPNPRVGLI